jgi:bacteriorhodopsin
MFDAIAIASIVVFGIGALYFFKWFASIDKTRLYLKKCTIYPDGNRTEQNQMISYSRKMILSISIALFVLCVASMALLLDHGFFMRMDGVTIWWPRYVAYSIAFPLLAFHIAVFLWHFQWTRVFAILCIFAVWILCGLIASFAHSGFQWAYFGIGMAPAVALYYTLQWHRNRRDNVANMTAHITAFMLALYLINWALSAPAAFVFSQETSFWIYFGFDIVTFIAWPHILLIQYISKWDSEEYQKMYRGKKRHYRMKAVDIPVNKTVGHTEKETYVWT